MSSKECRHSIVEYDADQKGHRCGYCGSYNTFFSYGMWAHVMKVEDYQDMIDKGWRRSGQHCYKPIMSATCCPMYTIRCAARDFKVSKSQRKIIKKFNNFIETGAAVRDENKSRRTDITRECHMQDVGKESVRDKNSEEMVDLTIENSTSSEAKSSEADVNKMPFDAAEKVTVSNDAAGSTPSVTNKDSKTRCHKAKYKRIERKRQKLASQGLSESEIERRMVEKKKMPVTKTIEDFINQPFSQNAAHKIEVRLVRSCPPSSEFSDSYDSCFELYKRYQMSVHRDPAEKITHSQFQRFLVQSPLQIKLVFVKSPEFEKSFLESASLFSKYQRVVHGESESDCSLHVFTDFLVDSPLEGKKGYGSYHQQYWLDQKLIAVGVLDILPRCVSSVYFYYDPEYNFLSLGTYGALREVAFTRSLHTRHPELSFYYMGFYIHSCVKMRYKAALRPSYLLCAEACSWHPVAQCVSRLERCRYARFQPDLSVRDLDQDVVLSDVLILHNRTAMTFSSYTRLNKCKSEEREEVMQYAKLVGMQCARRMLLYRP